MAGGLAGHSVGRRLMTMVPLLLVLLLVLILFGAGFAMEVLWWVALAVLVLWLVGFVARPKGSSGRWYRW
ncbi:hydrophobic protein [Streptomyces sp. JL4002]|uniref:hydrophobic protein n=2 Tax=Streptomyces TaxID=1883 RepID=UPI003B281995